MEPPNSTPTQSNPPPTETQQPPTPPPSAVAPPSTSSSIPQPSSLPPPSTSSLPPSSINPNPKPPNSQSQQQSSSLPNSQSRPPFNRPSWAPQQPPPPQQTHSHFPHFSASPSPPPVPSFSSSASPLVSSLPSSQRGGMAIGVPATPPPTFLNPVQPPPFSGPQFGTMARNQVNVPDSGPRSITNQLRGIQGTGMIGSLGTSSAMRPGGVPVKHQQRPVQSSLRPQANPTTTQNFQGHSLSRVASVGSPSSSQSLQPHNQPWLPSGSQGKPPLPPQQFRPQSLQQRSNLPQHHHSITSAQQQQQTSSGQQSPSAVSHQPQEHHGQQFQPSRIQQSLPHQQQIARGQGTGNQKLPSQTMVQSSTAQMTPSGAAAGVDSSESSNRILSKRSIHELVSQIDPSETLDPEVEDILIDIADEFVESITTFGCSLAKHRKSNTLEAKDILLHLERNWNMTLPGFSGDEIKGYRKPSASDIHRERVSAIKRSMLATETSNRKSTGGQAGGNVKSHVKAAANILGSPNP